MIRKKELQEECNSHGSVILNKGSKGPDPYEVELYLEKILSLMQLGEDYANFMTSKTKAPTSTDPELITRTTKAFCNHTST
ncbi:hypothetical protein VNO77_15706 [Canavalia gladiata]|uniref:Uncharacterized protein n=1 Tax=Canavalia gladiata TaxID=3824 RepID=A0AAN9M4K9_CANGL